MRRLLPLLAIVFIFLCNQQSIAQVTNVQAIGMTVADMDRSVEFYSEVLRFKKISDIEVQGTEWEKLYGIFGLRLRLVRMQLGDEIIELVDHLTTGGRSIPEITKSNDLQFQHIAIVVSNMDSAYQWLRKFNVQHVSTAPQTLPASIAAAAGIKAFYFQDPDRHNLEIIYFPKGKGQEKWQHQEDRIFLGIDHTAIGISNTAKSHYFYQHDLGFERKGDSWNKGIEQEHLNNIEGASLHITGYRTSGGPGVEFLEYLHPGPGKKYPVDSRPDDIWHWNTIVEVDNAAVLFNKVKAAKLTVISKEIVAINENDVTKYKAFVVRDPDGHAVLIRERF